MFIIGTGGGLGLTTTILTLPCYFEKYRGIATAILTGGVSTGMFLSPLIARTLVEKQGYQGAALIYGGYMLNTCVAAALFHPIRWHAKFRRRESILEELNKPLNEEKTQLNSVGKISIEEGRLKTGLRSREVSFNIRKNDSQSSQMFISQLSIAASTMNLSSLSQRDPLGQHQEEEPEDNKPKSKFASSAKMLKDISASVVEYMKVLKYYRAIILALGFSLFLSGYINFIMQVPFTMKAMGFTLEQSSWAISSAGICNLVFRLCTSTLSDFPKFNKRICYMVGAVLTTISTVSKCIFYFLIKYLNH